MIIQRKSVNIIEYHTNKYYSPIDLRTDIIIFALIIRSYNL